MWFRSHLTVHSVHVAGGDRLEVEVPGVPTRHVAIWHGPDPNDAEREVTAIETTVELEEPAHIAESLRDVVERHAAGKYFDQDDLSPELVEFSAQPGRELRAAGRSAFERLRWRVRADSPHRPYRALASEFSFDGVDWVLLPGRPSANVSLARSIHLTAESAAVVQELVDSGATEPLAHQLLREAIDVCSGNPRSATVVAVAAVETGIKHLIEELVPHASWLALNVPSPPLDRMLKGYLPLLPAREDFDGVVHPPPKYAQRQVRWAIEQRNLVAHRGEGSAQVHELHDVLTTLRDLLYLFDFYAGHRWALDQLSDRFRSELGT